MIYVVFAATALVIAYIIKAIRRYRRPDFTILTAEQKQILEKNIRFYAELNSDDKIGFEDKVEQFLDDVHIEGVGLELLIPTASW